MSLIEEILKTQEDHPEEWHRARVATMDLNGIPVYNPKNISVGRELFVTTMCDHKALMADPERTKAEFVDIIHGFIDDRYLDLPKATLEIDDEVLTRVECNICQLQQFLSAQQVVEVARRPMIPGAKPTQMMCPKCWGVISPLAESETAKSLLAQMSEHAKTCQFCDVLPVCPTGTGLARMLTNVELPGGKTAGGIANELLASSPRVRNRIDLEESLASMVRDMIRTGM